MPTVEERISSLEAKVDAIADLRHAQLLAGLFFKFEQGLAVLGLEADLPKDLKAMPEMRRQELADLVSAAPISTAATEITTETFMDELAATAPKPELEASALTAVPLDEARKRRISHTLVQAIKASRAGPHVESGQLLFQVHSDFQNLSDGVFLEFDPLAFVLRNAGGIVDADIYEGPERLERALEEGLPCVVLNHYVEDLPVERYSLELRRHVAEHAAKSSFEETKKALEATT